MHVTLHDPDLSRPLGLPALQQHPLYAGCLAALGTKAVAAEFLDGRDRIGRAQVYQRRIGPLRVFWLPRGPVWTGPHSQGPEPCALPVLRRAIGRSGIWITSTDCTTDGKPARRIPVLAELDLTADRDERLAAQTGKWRNTLRRAQGSGLTVEARPLQEADAALLSQEAAQRRRRGYAGLPHAFTAQWASRDRQATRIFIAHHEGRPVAFMLFLLHAPVATYHIGWTGPEGRRMAAHALLLWQASDWLAERGHLRLDLGFLDPRTPGLNRFKLGCGARPRISGATRIIPHFRP